MDLLNTIWEWVAAGHWLFHGIANAMILIVIGRLLIFGYREHSYLYQFEDKSRFLDAWINTVLPVVRQLGLQAYRQSVALKLSRAGTRRDWDANHFIASQIIYAGFAGMATYLLAVMVLGMGYVTVFGTMVFAMLLPFLKLSDLAAARYKAVNRDLPFFIDYLSLAMGAGLDFNQAMEKVVEDAPKSPIRDEFAIVLRNMKLGMNRADALVEMERRLSSPSLKLFVQTLVQGMELGSDVVHTLQVMSETRQQKRVQVAEESAGKISVKMMIPMMCFVMPAVMIVLLGPMVLTYFQAN